MFLFYLKRFLIIGWKAIKRYGIFAVVAIYLFRSFLFSGPVTRFLSQQIEEASGIKIKIGAFKGSYFFSLSLHDMALIEPDESLREMKVRQIYVGYNVLGPLFGERVLQRISLDSAQIEISPSPKDEPSGPPKKMPDLSGVDLGAILCNAPDISFSNIHFSYRTPLEKISVQNIHFINTRRRGELSAERIVYEDLSTNKTLSIQDIGVRWKITRDSITVYECTMDLPLIGKFSIEQDTLHFDIQDQALTFEKLAIPLIREAFLKGKITLANGCSLSLHDLSFTLKEISPLLKPFFPKIEPCRMHVTTAIDLAIPRWEIDRMQGIVDVEISRGKRSLSPRPLPDSGIKVRLLLDELPIVEEALKSLALLQQKPGCQGSLEVEAMIEALGKEKASCTGNAQVRAFCSPFFPPSPETIGCSWQIGADARSKMITVDRLSIEAMKAMVELKGSVDIPKWTAEMHCRLALPEIKSFLPENFSPKPNGSVENELFIKASRSSPARGQFPIEIYGTNDLRIPWFKILEHEIKDIAARAQFQIKEDVFAISLLSVLWEQIPLLEASARCDLDFKRPLSFQASLRMERFEKRLARYLPQEVVSGDLSLDVQGEASLGKEGHPPSLKTKLALTLKNGKVAGFPYREIRISFSGSCTPECLAIEEATVMLEGKTALKSKGTVYASSRPSYLVCELNFEEIPLQIRQALAEQERFLPRSVDGKIRVSGVLLDFLKKKAPMEIETAFFLRQGKVERWAYETLSLSCQARTTMDHVFLKEARVDWDRKMALRCRGEIVRDASVSLKIEGEAIVKELAEFLTEVDCSGRVRSRFRLSGKLPLSSREMEYLLLKTDATVSVTRATLMKKAFEDIQITVSAEAGPKRIVSEKFEVSYGEKKMVTARAALDFVQRDAKVRAIVGIPSFHRHLERFFPPEHTPWIPEGDLKVDLSMRGNLPGPNRLYSTAGKIQFGLQNLSLRGKKYEDISLFASFHHAPERFAVESLLLKMANETVLDARAELGLVPRRESSLRCLLRCRKVERYAPREMAKAFPSGDVEGNVFFKGFIPFVQEKGNFSAGLSMALKNGVLHDIPYEKIELKASMEGNEERIVLQKAGCSYNGTDLLNMKGSFSHPAENLHLSLFSRPMAIATKFLKADRFRLLVESDLSAEIKGRLSLEKGLMDLTADLKIPLAPLPGKEKWEIEFQDIVVAGKKKGPGEEDGIFAHAGAKGSLKDPTIDGTMSMRLSGVKSEQQDVSIRDLEVMARMEGHDILLDAKMLVGGSPLSCKGKISHRNYRPDHVEISVQGKRVLAIRDDQLYARADLDLLLKGRVEMGNAPKFIGSLSGTIDIPEVRVTVAMSLDSSGERVFMLPHFDFPFLDLDLDLKIKLSLIKVDNNLVKIEISGNLGIGGKLNDPQIKGWFSANSGKLFLPQGVMNITECMAQFKPEEPFIPHFEVRANTKVRDFEVFVIIRGKMFDFSIEFFSAPPLTKEDILLLLLTGATQSELSQSASEKLKETGSFILLQQLLNYVGVGDYISAQVTEESAAINLTPPQWKGFSIQGKVKQGGNVRFNVIYRLEFK